MYITQADIDRQAVRLENRVAQMTEANFAANAPAIADNMQVEQMDGLGKFGIKNITKAVKHATQVIKAAPKKQLEFAKLTVTNPKAAVKMAVKTNKTVVKETVKVGRQVAPVAAAAAAIYFGGPAAYAALQSMTAGSVVSGASTLLKGAGVVQSLAKLKQSNPKAAAELETMPPEQIAQSPLVQQAAAELTAQQQEGLGVSLQSPEAQELTQLQAAKGTQDVAAALQGKPSPVAKSSPVATAATIGIPAALILAKMAAVI